jgi:hypothetical protein
MRCMKLEPALEGTLYFVMADYELISTVGFLKITDEVIFIERCILELSKRNINIEDYLSTDGIANPYVLDPDLCHHTQCDREEFR